MPRTMGCLRTQKPDVALPVSLLAGLPAGLVASLHIDNGAGVGAIAHIFLYLAFDERGRLQLRGLEILGHKRLPAEVSTLIDKQ